MAVKWDHLWEVKPLSEETICGAEMLLGVQFPTDYRECLRVNHCAYPSPSEFVVDIEGRPFRSGLGPLLTIEPRARYMNMFGMLAPLTHEHGLPPEIIPIAQDGGGDFVCLDYRGDTTRSQPSVVYWHHELGGIDGLTPIAASFGDLLDLLQEEKDGA